MVDGQTRLSNLSLAELRSPVPPGTNHVGQRLKSFGWRTHKPKSQGCLSLAQLRSPAPSGANRYLSHGGLSLASAGWSRPLQGGMGARPLGQVAPPRGPGLPFQMLPWARGQVGSPAGSGSLEGGGLPAQPGLLTSPVPGNTARKQALFGTAAAWLAVVSMSGGAGAAPGTGPHTLWPQPRFQVSKWGKAETRTHGIIQTPQRLRRRERPCTDPEMRCRVICGDSSRLRFLLQSCSGAGEIQGPKRLFCKCLTLGLNLGVTTGPPSSARRELCTV